MLSEFEFQIALPQRRRFDEALNVALSKPLSLMLGDRGFEFPSLPPASPSQQQIAVGKVSPDPDHIRALALFPAAGNMEVGSAPRGRPRFVIRSGLSKRWKR